MSGEFSIFSTKNYDIVTLHVNFARNDLRILLGNKAVFYRSCNIRFENYFKCNNKKRID